MPSVRAVSAKLPAGDRVTFSREGLRLCFNALGAGVGRIRAP